MSKFLICRGDGLASVLQKVLSDLKSEVNEKLDNYILNVNETEFVNYLTSKYQYEKILLHFDEVRVDRMEKLIPARDFPAPFLNVREGKSYLKDVIIYYLPFEGNSRLLQYETNPSTSWSTMISIEGSEVCFEIVNFFDDKEKIIREAQHNINSIKKIIELANQQVDVFNKNLLAYAHRIFFDRKQHLLKQNNLLASLGVPIRKRENVSKTFAIPVPAIRQKIQVIPPISNEKGYQPEPTLDDSSYQKILKVIQDVGKQFEKMPSTYKNKSEEELRDHILLLLEPNFEGSATGETFNKTGKTDILLRYDGNNVFIGECKYWKGEKVYLDTISQLLGYLSWRDSKASVIMFVKNKDFSSVIEKVISVTPTHPNFLGYVGKKEDGTWLSYRFHINNDSNREVKLAVLLFHVPSV